MRGGVYGVRCLAGQRERPGALVRMSIRLSICVSVGALWELAAYCGSPVGGLCAPVHEKRPRERPPLPVAADGRFAAAHTPVGDDDRGGEGRVCRRAGRREGERKRVDARRNEDKTRVKQRGQRRPGMGMILHLSFLSSGFPFYSVLSFSLFVHLSASVFVYMGVCIAVCQYTSDMITKYNHRRTGERRALCQ